MCRCILCVCVCVTAGHVHSRVLGVLCKHYCTCHPPLQSVSVSCMCSCCCCCCCCCKFVVLPISAANGYVQQRVQPLLACHCVAASTLQCCSWQCCSWPIASQGGHVQLVNAQPAPVHNSKVSFVQLDMQSLSPACCLACWLAVLLGQGRAVHSCGHTQAGWT
jgi:hypothetical protein